MGLGGGDWAASESSEQAFSAGPVRCWLVPLADESWAGLDSAGIGIGGLGIFPRRAISYIGVMRPPFKPHPRNYFLSPPHILKFIACSRC